MSMERAPHLSRYMLEVREYHKLMYLNQQIVYIAYILFSHHSCFSPGATEKTVNDEESKGKEVGLGVGIVLAVIILAVVVALLVGVVWWYHK